MYKLLIAILTVAIIVYAIRRIKQLPPKARRSAFIQLALILTVLVVVALTITGRMHWIGAALTGLLVLLRQALPLLIRLIPAWLNYRSSGIRSDTGKNSTVESQFLSMELDHETGKMSGQVLQGQYQNSSLDEMSREELEDLFSFFLRNDQDSSRLLESYLNQRFPDSNFESKPPPQSESHSEMSPAEALSILGLDGEPDSESVITAHRKLMQKLHPDRGGNDYLAAKINQAKDVLLS